MTDLAGRPGLVHEPAPKRVVGRELRPEHLQRDLVALGLVDGAEDHAHPTLAEAFLESIGADAPAGFEFGHAVRIDPAPALVGRGYDDRP